MGPCISMGVNAEKVLSVAYLSVTEVRLLEHFFKFDDKRTNIDGFWTVKIY